MPKPTPSARPSARARGALVNQASPSAPRQWLVKQEPEDYSWDRFVREGRAAWTGVRNFQARNNLRLMRAGDRVLFYHSGKEKQAVGLATVARAAYPDPTSSETGWVAVDLTPLRPLATPVTLVQMKGDRALANLPLIRQTRLSVMPLTAAEFDRLLALAEVKR